MPNITELLWPITALTVFIGMWMLNWRSLSIAHDLAKMALQAGLQPPTSPVAVPGPTTKTTVTTTVSAPSSVPSTPVVDEGLLEFVKKAEGFAPTAKWDYKQYTYGYGTKAPGEGATITEAEAEVPLKQELAEAAALVEKFAPNAPKGVKQALTDLTFNAGTGWETGNLGAEIKAGNYAAAAKSILRYNHAGGQVLDGLTIRRQSEASWFNDPL